MKLLTFLLLSGLMIGCAKKPEPKTLPTGTIVWKDAEDVGFPALTMSSAQTTFADTHGAVATCDEKGDTEAWAKGVFDDVRNCKLAPGRNLDDLVNSVIAGMNQTNLANKQEHDRLTAGWCQCAKAYKQLTEKRNPQ